MNGRPVTVTLSPALTDVDFQPFRTSHDGGFISQFQISDPPFLFATSTSSQEWGLPHLNDFTVPSTTTVFVRSTPAPEWCAKIGIEERTAEVNTAATQRRFMLSS